jgi:hypothetical protein
MINEIIALVRVEVAAIVGPGVTDLSTNASSREPTLGKETNSLSMGALAIFRIRLKLVDIKDGSIVIKLNALLRACTVRPGKGRDFG